MAKIVFTWELGGGMGHIMSHLSIGEVGGRPGLTKVNKRDSLIRQ